MKANYEDNGISVMVSALGSTEVPTTLGVDPVEFAKEVATWAIDNHMDGIDVDYEVYSIFLWLYNQPKRELGLWCSRSRNSGAMVGEINDHSSCCASI